ncbi:crotonase/enoyl-CoA hydratase family protein [Calidifontimicrobium sp. SYSU G02091]|uniref:crotonase/enoyl-CoA hydratase family protein n=1 Tax=Azohydromonas TaxID=312063 RepID=UPI000E64C353|nr:MULTISPECIES: crotonase/enoyl-CoA hydratase family protein [Azohydromonas]MCI1191913.1 crotonase/enoyl-CoA hydratase family protein [Calidifontimicrobium sp. SYSU G02091]
METVGITRDGPVWTVTLQRPAARNAVDGPTARALAAALRAFDADADARVAVLAGAGGHFCAGADLKAVAEGGERMNPLEDDLDADGPMGPTRLVLTKPVIAAVSGHAVAGGFELALWCDLRVVDDSAVFGVFCRRWGVPLIDGGTVRLPRLIGESRALDLILTGRAVDADEAMAIGLATRRAAPGQTALDAALALARELAALPQTCLRSDLASVKAQAGLPLRDALAHEFALGMATLASGESREGAARFAGGAGRHGRPA